jgi:hypothetical protein
LAARDAVERACRRTIRRGQGGAFLAKGLYYLERFEIVISVCAHLLLCGSHCAARTSKASFQLHVDDVFHEAPRDASSWSVGGTIIASLAPRLGQESDEA